MTRVILIAAAALACGCVVHEERKPELKAVAPPVLPADETRRFPMDGRESVEPMAGPLFGMGFLPGGNVAVYRKGGKTWKQFVVKTESAGETAVLLSKVKDALRGPKFVAHMGGYFGMAGDQPFFVFPKGRWLAGTVGLPEKEADTAGRVMALRLD